jgi:fibro-slime domain-containing protein
LGATATGYSTGVVGGKTACVPDSSGSRATATGYCPSNDAVGPCPGIAASTLNELGKPVLANDTCPCAFTDWDQTGILTGVSGATTCLVEGEGLTRQRLDTDVKAVHSAESFAEWFSDSSFSTRVHDVLELAADGSVYRFSSSTPDAPPGAAGRDIQDDIHGMCLGTATSLSSGYFPLEEQSGSGSTKLCNIWPYWLYSTATSATCRAGSGYPVLGQWDPLAAWDACPSTGTGGFVPNSSGIGTPVQGVLRNYYFSSEIRFTYPYTAPVSLSIESDDDTWVFVNGQLAIDLGSTHPALPGSTTLGPTFGMVAGQTYEIVIFRADRHPRDSTLDIRLPPPAGLRTQCQPTCGDGVVTANEECDEGDANADGAYGGCETNCRFGPFCGDGIRNGTEECDTGLSNGNGSCDEACRSM